MAASAVSISAARGGAGLAVSNQSCLGGHIANIQTTRITLGEDTTRICVPRSRILLRTTSRRSLLLALLPALLFLPARRTTLSLLPGPATSLVCPAPRISTAHPRPCLTVTTSRATMPSTVSCLRSTRSEYPSVHARYSCLADRALVCRNAEARRRRSR